MKARWSAKVLVARNAGVRSTRAPSGRSRHSGRVSHATFVEPLEAVLGDGGTGEVTAETFELGMVGAVQSAGGVDVEALDDADPLPERHATSGSTRSRR